MGLSRSETSCVLYDLSGHPGLDGFDSEAERRARPLEVQTAAAGSLRLAPVEKLPVFSVIEQYGPADLDRIDSARPLPPWWNGTRVAGVVILVAVVIGLPVAIGVLPESRAADPQARPASTAEARPASAAAAIVPASAPVPNPPPTVPQPASARASSRPARTGGALELSTVRRAFASLDIQNVPLENCVARVPAVDRVVVRCHGEPADEWTLDFNRALDRWQVVGAPAR